MLQSCGVVEGEGGVDKEGARGEGVTQGVHEESETVHMRACACVAHVWRGACGSGAGAWQHTWGAGCSRAQGTRAVTPRGMAA